MHHARIAAALVGTALIAALAGPAGAAAETTGPEHGLAAAPAHPGHDRAETARDAKARSRDSHGKPERADESAKHRDESLSEQLHQLLRRDLVSGIVAQASATSLTVGKRTLPVAPQALVWAHGQAESVAALPAGAWVAALLSGGRVVLVDVLQAPSAATQGVVAVLDGHRLTLAIPAANGGVSTAVYAVQGQTVISGAVKSWSAVAPGDSVSLSTTGHGRNVASLQVVAAPSQFSGTITAVRDGWLVLTVTESSGKVPVRYRLNDHTTVLINGQPGRRKDLAVGDTATVTPGSKGRARSVAVTASSSAATSAGSSEQ